MQLTLDCGRTGLVVTLPGDRVAHVLGLTPAPPLSDPDTAIAAALSSPIDRPPLREVARGRRDACLTICDITRPVPNARLLPPILAILADAGIPASRVTILIATGTHRPNLGDELREMVGDAVLHSGATIVNHACDDPATHRFLETTPRGVPVALDTRWLDADLRVSVGLIEPHFMAGYSGGRKLVMPGLAALETIQAWHSPRFLEHPAAAAGIVDGNPVHDENTYIARLCPADFLCDVTIDASRALTGVFAGDPETAWRAGVRFVEGQVRAPIPAPVDIAVTSGGGYPLDATFYQLVKGIVGAAAIVRPGGTIVAAAALSEGIGSPHFVRTLAENADLDALVAAMQRPDWTPIPDQWQVEELAKATRQHRVVVISDGVPADALARCHVTPAPSVEAAVADALARHGAAARIAVVPKGPYVLPVVAP